MDLEMRVTPEGDLVFRSGDQELIFPNAALLAAVVAGDGASVVPAPSPAPMSSPPPASAQAGRRRVKRIGRPKDLPGAMAIITARSARGMARPRIEAYGGPPASSIDWNELHDAWTAGGARQVGAALRKAGLEVQPASSREAVSEGSERILDVRVKISYLRAAGLNLGELQQIADDPDLRLDGVRLHFE
jgi:hypothetical protein